MNREKLLDVGKPILFNTEMVKAILEGRKTCTRRITKFKPRTSLNETNGYFELYEPVTHNFFKCKVDFEKWAIEKCRYKVGDILYVRETFNGPHYQNGYKNPSFLYKADLNENVVLGSKWKPSIHMPKKAARIFLKVTDVRVERLQDIGIKGIMQEGVKATGPWDYVDYLEAFAELWNSTIKNKDLDQYGWEANPWVWVVEFERVEVEE